MARLEGRQHGITRMVSKAQVARITGGEVGGRIRSVHSNRGSAQTGSRDPLLSDDGSGYGDGPDVVQGVEDLSVVAAEIFEPLINVVEKSGIHHIPVCEGQPHDLVLVWRSDGGRKRNRNLVSVRIKEIVHGHVAHEQSGRIQAVADG